MYEEGENGERRSINEDFPLTLIHGLTFNPLNMYKWINRKIIHTKIKDFKLASESF